MLSMAVCCAGVLNSMAVKKSTAVYMPLNNRIVVIDAGHGGWDPGKTGKSGMNEKDINIDIAQKLCLFLEEAGADVYFTRNDDEALGQTKSEDMKKRISVVDESNADIMISIHQNAYPSENVKGAQTFYFKGSDGGKALAEKIQASLISALDEKNKRTAKENTSYYIIKNTVCYYRMRISL